MPHFACQILAAQGPGARAGVALQERGPHVPVHQVRVGMRGERDGLQVGAIGKLTMAISVTWSW